MLGRLGDLFLILAFACLAAWYGASTEALTHDPRARGIEPLSGAGLHYILDVSFQSDLTNLRAKVHTLLVELAPDQTAIR